MNTTLCTTNNVLPSKILWHLEGMSKKQIFEKVCFEIESMTSISKEKLFQQLIAKERTESTTIGNFGAIPYIRVKEMTEPLSILVHLKEPIWYSDRKEKNQNNVQTMIFLFFPEKVNDIHLCLLAIFAEILTESSFMTLFSQCADETAAYQQLSHWQEERLWSLEPIFAQKT